MMKRIHTKLVFSLLLALALVGGVASCRGEAPVATDPSDDLTLTPTPAPDPDGGDTASSPTPASSPEGVPDSPESTAEMMTVTIFKADDQCVNFLPEEVQVAGDRPIEGAVGKVLEGQGSGDFDLNGYRVNIDEASGIATVDLRMNPDSDRTLVSLSACEQFALFGSLRETLVQNPAWNIKEVRFTEGGEEILL